MYLWQCRVSARWQDWCKNSGVAYVWQWRVPGKDVSRKDDPGGVRRGRRADKIVVCVVKHC